MEAISSTNAQAILDSYYQFSDGLVRYVAIEFGSTKSERKAIIICSARDREDDAWCNVIWEVSGLAAFAISDGPTSYVVLSQGIQIGWFADKVYFDLGPYTSEPDCEGDFQRSGFYFCGHGLSCQKVPYDEHPRRSQALKVDA